MFSPSFTKLTSVTGTKSDITPVILKSTLLDKSPFSNPNIVSLSLISSPVLIPTFIPLHPKNWLIDFEV